MDAVTHRAKLRAYDLGGLGSGNFGHSGRPGEVGGSSGMAARLPDRPDSFFERDARTLMLPVGDVQLPGLSDPDKFNQSKVLAVGLMQSAAAGQIARRQPVTVVQGADGRYVVASGLATTALVKAAGWKQIPVRVEPAAVLPGDESVTVGGRTVAITRSERADVNGDLLVPVDVAAFDQAWKQDGGFHLDPSGRGKIGTRLEGVQRYLKTATSMEAAEVTVQADGRVSVKDGRHRMAVLRDAGVPRVPVAMSLESLAHAKKYGLLAKPRGATSLTFSAALHAILLGGEVAPPREDAAKHPTPKELSDRKQQLLALFTQALNLDWDEGLHPRDDAGKFAEGEGGGAEAVAKGIQTFEGNKGYEWHERPEMVEYVEQLPYEEARAIGDYASFSYGDINAILRGTFTESESLKAVGHQARMEATIEKINGAIRDHGYALKDPMVVNRAAYIPGLSYDDLKAMEGETMEEKGFTSTMAGNPSGRLDGYVTMGKAESLYKRFGSTYANQDEVGVSMRVAIILPEGTKVAPVEAIRRTEYEFPKVQDPEVFNHPEWLTNDDGTPNGLKASDYTIRDYTAKPTRDTTSLTDPNQFERTRSEAEVLLGSGAQFRVLSVNRAPRRIVSSDPQMKPIDVVDVELEYIGGGSSEAAPKKRSLRSTLDLGGAGSGNFGHAGRPGEVGGSASGDGGSTKSESTFDKGGSGGGKEATSVGAREAFLEAKRGEFHALVKTATDESEVDGLRDGVNKAWQAWVADINNRKKPLKETGAAAKKLDTYKAAMALQAEFHAKYDALRIEMHAAKLAAKELLKVPVSDRSKVTFRSDQTMHPALEAGAKKALADFRQFDASGAFQPLRFPADKVEQFRAAFGDNQKLEQNDDGTYSLPVELNLTKSETSRANATMFGIAIGGGRELDRQVYHEVAHHIELRNTDVRAAAIAWREARANSPREVFNLYEVSPSLGKEERAVRGDYGDPYTGKIYPDDIATEVISTGVEQYMTDPVRFARDSPDHFNLIFDVMHGKYEQDKRISPSDVK